MLKGALAQLSSGLILGLSATIYAVSYAALMFSGPLAAFMPYAISLTLVTAAVGGLYGFFSEEATLVNGPDSNTSSILAGVLAGTVAAGAASGAGALNDALVILAAASLFTAACYFLIVRFGLVRLVRYVPFQVMAGFLASTGWLMASGALNIIAGTPLTVAGLAALAERPGRPELAAGIGLAFLLGLMQRRLRPALAIPLFIVVASVAVNLAVRRACAGHPACDPALWFFPAFDRLAWQGPWDLRLDRALLLQLLALLPAFLAVAFVATLTVLLSFSSLELTYGRDFRLDRALHLHGVATVASTALGGYLGLVSIGRSTMCRATGGGRGTGWVIALFCLAVMLGLGALLSWMPRAGLGALVLYLGYGMLRQWFWDLRRTLPRPEWLQVLAILLCVVAFGYVVGFVAGLLAACIFFVVNYSSMPFIALDSTLATTRSSVIRIAADQEWLAREGGRCRVARFEGFIFFGVASAIYDWWNAEGPARPAMCLLDFSRATGADPSAAAVLQKIVRLQGARGQALLLVPGPFAALPEARAPHVTVAPDMDTALEHAEELLLRQRGELPVQGPQRWLGADASDEELRALLEYLQPVRLGAGEPLFHAGQPGDGMYFVASGGLEVVESGRDGRRLRLAKVRSGAMLGEMALYTGRPRAASAIATEPSELLLLSVEALGRMQREQPALASRLDRQVVLALASTVARTTALLRLQG